MSTTEFELEESGQFTLGVDGEQRSLEGLAAPGKPAPVSHEMREPDEPVEPTYQPTHVGFSGNQTGTTTSAEDDRRARGMVLFNGQEITREAYDRIRGVTPAEKPKPAARTYSCGSCGKTLKAERWIYSRHTGSRYCWPGECRGGK